MVDQPAAPRYGALGVVYACVILLALTLTWVFLGMRAVMDIGGACAEGGPYVSAQPCPDAASVLVSLGIPVMLLSAFVGTGVGIGLGAPNLLVPMWTFLFGSLGWNFLEYGLFTDAGIVWGWLVCGVLFEAMALPALWVMLPVGRRSWTPRVRQEPGAAHATWQWAAAYAVLSVAGVVLAVWSYRAWS